MRRPGSMTFASLRSRRIGAQSLTQGSRKGTPLLGGRRNFGTRGMVKSEKREHSEEKKGFVKVRNYITRSAGFAEILLSVDDMRLLLLRRTTHCLFLFHSFWAMHAKGHGAALIWIGPNIGDPIR